MTMMAQAAIDPCEKTLSTPAIRGARGKGRAASDKRSSFTDNVDPL